MKLTLKFVISALIVLTIYNQAIYGQANLTFSGGNGAPLSITLRQSVLYTITDADCAASGPIFIFDEVGNPFFGAGLLVTGDIAYSVNAGTSQPITNTNSGVAVSDVTANDVFIYGNLGNSLVVGNTIILSPGTVTTTTNIAAVQPTNGNFTTFLTNDSGVRCSSDGIAIGPTAARTFISGRVLTSKGRGLSNAFVYLTDQDGNTKTGKTNSFGYYRFTDIQPGQTVTVKIVSKQYSFAPKVINLDQAMTDLDFIAER